MVESTKSVSTAAPDLKFGGLRKSAKSAVQKLVHQDSKRTSMIAPRLVKKGKRRGREKKKNVVEPFFLQKKRNVVILLVSGLLAMSLSLHVIRF